MSKKLLSVILVLVIISIFLFLGYSVIDKILYKKQIINKIQSLPQTPVYNLDSTVFQLSSIPTTLLIYFNTECEHCQYEADEIKRSIKYFKEKKIVFISSENIKSIDEFSLTRGFNIYPFIYFVKIAPEDVYNTFGSIHAPHIFIYSKDRKLIKEFEGETKIEAILQYLPK